MKIYFFFFGGGGRGMGDKDIVHTNNILNSEFNTVLKIIIK